jgi:hypothetical protein
MTLLPRLVDKSLVSAAGRGTRRYWLLETLRAYAAERLAASGAGPAARSRQAARYRALAEHSATQLRMSNQRTALDRLATEQPNLRTALAHSINTGDPQYARRWIAALQRFWNITGQRREAQPWIQRALAIGDPPATSVVVTELAAASTILQPSDSHAAFDLATSGHIRRPGSPPASTTSREAGRPRRRHERDLNPAGAGAARTARGARPVRRRPPWESALAMHGLAQTTRECPPTQHRFGDQRCTGFVVTVHWPPCTAPRSTIGPRRCCLARPTPPASR